MKNLVIVDDFYSDPSKLRSLAKSTAWLGSEQRPRDFFGNETVGSFFNQAVVDRLSLIVGATVVPDPVNCSFGVFQLATEADEGKNGIHVDQTEWTAIVYLTPNEHACGGTTFYKHRNTQETLWPDDPTDASRISQDLACEEAWDRTGFVGVKYNRLLVFRAGKMFHRASKAFGSDFDTGRLIQLFFFNTVEKTP